MFPLYIGHSSPLLFFDLQLFLVFITTLFFHIFHHLLKFDYHFLLSDAIVFSQRNIEIIEDKTKKSAYKTNSALYGGEFVILFDKLKEMGWLKPEYNTPSYIVDNIAINGEIKPYNEIESDYNLNGMSVDEWIEDNGYYVVGDPDKQYVIINFGL